MHKICSFTIMILHNSIHCLFDNTVWIVYELPQVWHRFMPASSMAECKINLLYQFRYEIDILCLAETFEQEHIIKQPSVTCRFKA